MRRTWTLTDLEFIVLWEQLEESGLPAGFSFQSGIPNYLDYLREYDKARDGLDRNVDLAVHDVLKMVSQPDIRIVVRGRDGIDPDNPEAGIRLHAVRRGGEGYLIEQLPGRTVDHSGGFTITEVDAVKLADALVAKLPDVPAGSRSRVPLPPPPSSDVDDEYGRSALWDSFDEDADRCGSRFLEDPATAVGTIEVVQGISRFGPRGRVRRDLYWLDRQDDGRYVITRDQPPVAQAADAARLVALINAEVATVVRAIRDERR
ncbi:ESX secretion-associated protein EspG [Nocardia lijiangensis]|uniref:ESX secretion-associated protein EspG n=1 Tax=Nocardia lijiangensis TaxID=299618 RepID=UPI003D751DFC